MTDGQVQPNNELKEDPKNEILKGSRPVIARTYPKFRFWDVQLNKFFFSSNALFGDIGDAPLFHEFIAPHVIVVDKHEKKLTPDDLQWLSEFTGVLDSTPEMKPIFSGDIVRIPNAQAFDADEEFVVQWAVPFARWNISPYLVGRREIYIVGNIYQNPQPEKREMAIPKFEINGDISKVKKKNHVVN